MRLWSPFSMGTIEGPCLTGGLRSIWGPPHPSEHDGAPGPGGRRLSSHGGKGEQLRVSPESQMSSAAEAGMDEEKHDLRSGVRGQHKPWGAKANGRWPS